MVLKFCRQLLGCRGQAPKALLKGILALNEHGCLVIGKLLAGQWESFNYKRAVNSRSDAEER